MSKQKKAVIIIVILAVIFVGFVVSGAIIFDGDHQETAESYTESQKEKKSGEWLEKPMAFFTPSLSPQDIHFVSSSRRKCKFKFDEDDDKPFRSLKLSIERIPGASSQARASFIYTSTSSTNDDLKKQSSELKSKPEDKRNTTLVILKDGGNIELTLSSGSRLFMQDGEKKIWLCKKARIGNISVNPDLKEKPLQ